MLNVMRNTNDDSDPLKYCYMLSSADPPSCRSETYNLLKWLQSPWLHSSGVFEFETMQEADLHDINEAP